jgi:hypothetical protein
MYPQYSNRRQAGEKLKDSNVIKMLYMALLGSALILSICAPWLAVKDLRTD